MTYRFRSRSQAILMGISYVPTWKLCPSIPTWKQYPLMPNNIKPIPTQNPWAWMGLGMGMGMSTQ